MRIMILALALLASAANGVTIWGSTSRAPAGGTERIPVDTSSSSTPGHLTVANIGTWVWSNPTSTLGLANGGTGAVLADPGADRIVFWDESANSTAFLTAGTGLTITGTTIAASGGASTSGLGGYYGDGSAGDLTSSSGVTTVSAANQVQYDDVTLTSTATLYTAGRVIYVDVLDLSGAPARAVNVDGGAASGTTAGTSLADTGRQTPATGTSSNGGASATGGGVSSSTLTAGRIVLTSDVVSYSSAGRGGNGGAGAGGAGGTSGAMPNALTAGQLLASIPTQPETVSAWLRSTSTSISTPATQYHGYVNNGSTGGGGGGGNGLATGSAGGGGGGTAGPLIVYARTIIVSASTPACVLSASGGSAVSSSNATNNNTGTGGGGGGGQGGIVIVVTDSVTATDATTSVTGALCADGAAGGSAGTPMGTGVSGTGGYSGRGGRVIFWNKGLGTTSYAGPTAGNAPSGATGGAIAQARVDLVVN